MVGGIEGDTGRSTMNTKGKTNPVTQISFKIHCLFIPYRFQFIGMKDRKFPLRSRFVAVTPHAGYHVDRAWCPVAFPWEVDG